MRPGPIAHKLPPDAVPFVHRKCRTCKQRFASRQDDTSSTCPSCRERAARRRRNAERRRAELAAPHCRECGTELLEAVPKGLCGMCDPDWIIPEPREEAA
jgi:hypothetical protein